MKSLLLVIASLAAICAIATHKSEEMTSSFMNVKSTDLDLRKVNSPNPNIQIYVDHNSIEEYYEHQVTFRTASVVYHFTKPMIVRGKEVYWMYTEAGYECQDKMFLSSSIIMYGKTVKEPLFTSKGTGEVEIAQSGSVVYAELSYICDQTINTPPTKTPEAVKSKKLLDI